MSTDNRSEGQSRRGVARRQFLACGGLTGALAALRSRILAGEGRTPPSERVNVACIGVGSQGLRVMLNFLRQPDVQVVSVCDPNKESSDYPQWGATEFRDAVRKLLGTTTSWDSLSTTRAIQLTRTMKVMGGTAGREPCQKIVDAYYATRKASGQYRGCTAYADFRELLEKEKDVDAVVVCTGDHWHAPISVAAMKKGKHVYCQKPMTRTVYEARRVGEVAREAGVATQVAVGNQASEATRVLCEWVWGGAIGPVHQVVNWSSRPFWPQGVERPTETAPVPAGLDWDLWLGPAPQRPYHPIYHPFSWRGWHDFGCGAIGDMGCYSFDTIFRVLKLEAPESVEASSSEAFAETYPKASVIHFAFPKRGTMPPVKVRWYDGGLRPPRPEGLDEGHKLPAEGLLFLGEKGSILCGFTGDNPIILPESRRKAYELPPKTLPRSIGHDREWIEACKGSRNAPGASFGFSGLVTEAILLGNVALRTGERLLWDRANLKANNVPAAQPVIQPEYRRGWAL
ncbi:MAG: Gfo/Idh/MocA family oxidoreductase [Planctomycetes bacterium]|nr:Gfo/Idh/MocA family oxidoreductase [Planctomycetota bacterium]